MSDHTSDPYAGVYQDVTPQLLAYATSLTGSAWTAEDLVAEAHFRVWRRMRAGHEIENVPAYLRTTIRNLAVNQARAAREFAGGRLEPGTEDESTPAAVRAAFMGGAGSTGHGYYGASHAVAVVEPEQRASHVDLLARLIKGLPERWAKALWYAEVEDLPLEEVGARVGAGAGATAVLLNRAREGLRQAFLQEAEPGAPREEACKGHWKHIPAVVRGKATARQERVVREHADACDDCRARMLALTQANLRLPVILGPALLLFVVGGGKLAAMWGVASAAATGGASGAATVTAGGSASGAHAAAAGGSKHAAASGSRAAAKAGTACHTRHLAKIKHGAKSHTGVVLGAGAVVGIAAVATAMALVTPNGAHAAAAIVPAHSTGASPATQLSSPPAVSSAKPAPATPAAPAQHVAPPANPQPANVPASNNSVVPPPTSAVPAPIQAQQQTPQTPSRPSAPSSTPPNSFSAGPVLAPSPVTSTPIVVPTPTQTPSQTPTTQTSAPAPSTQSPTPAPTVTPTQTPTCILGILNVCILQDDQDGQGGPSAPSVQNSLSNGSTGSGTGQ